jgi:hypothetical protein
MLTELAAALEAQVAKLPVAANELSKKAAKAIVQDLALITPVDQGTALSNWQASLDIPLLDQRLAFVPSPKGKMIDGVFTHSIAPDVTRQNNATELIAEANAVIESKQPGQTLFIANALAYIQSLNEGSSEQAPAGFVDRAAVLAQSVVDSGLKLG